MNPFRELGITPWKGARSIARPVPTQDNTTRHNKTRSNTNTLMSSVIGRTKLPPCLMTSWKYTGEWIYKFMHP